jgi:hypothetical protein
VVVRSSHLLRLDFELSAIVNHAQLRQFQRAQTTRLRTAAPQIEIRIATSSPIVADPTSTMFALFPLLPQALMHPNDDAALEYFRYAVALFWRALVVNREFGKITDVNYWLAFASQKHSTP